MRQMTAPNPAFSTRAAAKLISIQSAVNDEVCRFKKHTHTQNVVDQERRTAVLDATAR